MQFERKLIALIATCLPLLLVAQAPQEIWTLQRAVHYAVDHNLSIQQSVLNQRVAALTLKHNQLMQLPNLNVNSSYGRSYGRSIDPTTNQFVSGTSYDFASISGSADVLLFGWFQRRNAIKASQFALEASKADLDQLKNDVSLNVATGYLRALLAQEQIRISEKQAELSRAQLEQTRQFAQAGRLPELSVAQLESQLANDSANLISAISNFNSAIIDVKAILNLDFETSFQLQAPDVKIADQILLSQMTPAAVYEVARQQFGSIKAPMLRKEAQQKNVAAAKSALLPQFGLNVQAGSNFSSTFSEVTGITITGTQPSPAFVQFTDSLRIPVYQPTYQYQTRRIPFGRQLDNNFRQTVAFSLSIPLFNGWQAQNNFRQARINLLGQDLSIAQAELKLRQDVYKAYNEAVNAVQKFYAAQRSTEAARRAYSFAQKRYELGLTNTVDYLIAQNNQFVSEANLLSVKYDLIFKLKVIDYYLGKELKL